MAMLFDDGSGNQSSSATLASASTTLDGIKLYTAGSQVGNQVLSSSYSCAADTKFKSQYRYYNGTAWMAWHDMEDDDGNINYEYKSADATNYPQTGICEYTLYNQRGYKPRALGVQIRTVRISGNGDITFTDGVMS